MSTLWRILLCATTGMLVSPASLAAIAWFEDIRYISGRRSVECSACESVSAFDMTVGTERERGLITLEGFPGVATRSEAGAGASLTAESRAALTTRAISVSGDDRFVFDGTGSSWARVSGAQNGTDETGSATASADSFLYLTLEIDRPYRAELFGDVRVDSGAALLNNLFSTVELRRFGLSEPMLFFAANAPGETLLSGLATLLGASRLTGLRRPPGGPGVGSSKKN